jgi:hypothetical protein
MDAETANSLQDWSDQQQKRLIAQPLVGYANGEPATAEPVAFAAITACAYDLKAPAETACRRLLEAQNANGSISVRLNDEGPYWPTSLASIAWRQFERVWPQEAGSWCSDAYRRGIDFLTSFGGQKIDADDIFGHNTQLVGWPWVDGTHSWLEPTAMALLAMRHCGFAKHARAVEAAELLLDRQLPSGGANYGNTYVLGQKLRPHVMPSAMCTVALHRFTPQPKSHQATIDYLRSEIHRPIAAISLAWAIHALTSASIDNEDPSGLDFRAPLRSAIERLQVTGDNPHRQNMLLLSANAEKSPLLDLAYHSLPLRREASR